MQKKKNPKSSQLYLVIICAQYHVTHKAEIKFLFQNECLLLNMTRKLPVVFI